MFQHDYDDNGLPTSCLLLTILFPIALSISYSLCKRTGHFPCECLECKKNKKAGRWWKLAAVSVLWVLVIYLCYRIRVGVFTSKKSSFDPLTILDIEEGSTLAVMKKAYRKKARLVQKGIQKGTAAEEDLANVNKAFNIVSDPEAYSKWISSTIEEKQIIALPSIFMKLGFFSCLFYIFVLCAALPLYVYFRYKKLQNKSPLGVFYTSIESFCDNMDLFSKNEDILIPQLILFISRCEEFTAYKWRSSIPDLKKDIENTFGIPLLSNEDGYLRIFDYLCRMARSSEEDIKYIKEALLSMVRNFREASKICERYSLYKGLLTLEKMVVQAVCSPSYAMMQFPNVRLSDVVKEDVSGKMGDSRVSEYLNRTLKESERAEAVNVLENIPRVRISKLRIFVLDTETIEEDGTEKKYKKVEESEGSEFKVEKGAVPTLSFELVRDGGVGVCHSPYGNGTVPVIWSVFYTFNGSMRPCDYVLSDFSGRKSLTFSLPSSTGKQSDLKLYVCLNGHFYADAEAAAVIKYY